jgi:hypothetical protein
MKYGWSGDMIGGWMGYRAGVDAVEERKLLNLPEIEHRSSSPKLSRNTN